jgi:hypothetical protein
MVDHRANLASAALFAALILVLGGCAESALLATRGGGAAAPEDQGDYNYDPDDPFGDDDDATPPDGGDDDDDDADDDDLATSWVEVISYDPEPGSVDHHYRSPVVIGFNDVALSATVGILDMATGYGMPAEQQWSDDGKQVTVSPSTWLAPLAEYAVVIDLGDASLEYTFTTSSIGTPIGMSGDPAEVVAALDGRIYEIDFGSAWSDSTPTLGTLLGTLNAGPAWLWQVGFEDGEQELDLMTGLADTDADGNATDQDLCTTTQVLGTTAGAIELADPYFASPPGELMLRVDGVDIVFEQAWVDGDFAADGASLHEIGFRGWLRAETIEPFVTDGSCDWLGDSADAACQVCPSGYGECAWVELYGLSGIEATVEFGEVNDDDVDPDCADDGLEILSCSFGATPARGSLLALLLVGLGAAILRRRSG